MPTGASASWHDNATTCSRAFARARSPRRGRSTLPREVRAAGHRRPGHARQVASGAGTARPRDPLGGRRAGARSRTGRADSHPRTSKAGCDGAAAPAAQPCERALHPGRGEAGGLAARWQPVHVLERERPSLQRARVPGIRPRGPGGSRRAYDSREPAAALPSARSGRASCTGSTRRPGEWQPGDAKQPCSLHPTIPCPPPSPLTSVRRRRASSGRAGHDRPEACTALARTRTCSGSASPSIGWRASGATC